MNGLEFAARLIEALAWPSVAVGCVLILRRPLARLLMSDRVKRLKAGPSGIELEYWDEAVKEAKGELDGDVQRQWVSIEAVVPEDDEIAGGPFREEMRSLARISPRAAVLESFIRLEQLLRTELSETVSVSSRPLSVRSLGHMAEEQGLLMPQERMVLEDLIPLRNAAAHSGADGLDEARAIEFSELVRQLMIAVLLARGVTGTGS